MPRTTLVARLGLALLLGPVLAATVAVLLTRHWPDPDGLNRLYRGLFVGVVFQAVWMTACLLLRRPSAQPWKRLVSATHHWAGAILGVMLFVICLSGTLAVLKPELQHWERTAQQRLPQGTNDADAWLAAGLAQFPNAPALQIGWPQHLSRQVVIRPQSGPRPGREAPLLLQLDEQTASTLEPATATQLLVELHRHLHAGFPGRILVSLFGFALLLLIITGVILHPRRRDTALRLRLAQRMAIWSRDAHLLMGLWLLPGLLLLAATGVFSGMGALGTLTLAPHAFPDAPQQAMRELMPGFRQAASGQAATMPALSELLAHHQARHPDFQIEQATLHHWGDAQAYVSLSGQQHWQLSTPLFEQFHYQAVDGSLLRHETAASRGGWTQAFIAIQPLHFGTYAGKASRWLHAALGLAATLLCASGLYLWLRRQPPGRKTAAHRLLPGACLGLLAACCSLLAGAALLPSSATGATLLPMVFWATWATLTLGFTLLRRTSSYSPHVLAICALLLGLTVAATLPRLWLADTASQAALSGVALLLSLTAVALGLCARALLRTASS